jgi:hypothetical protein
LAFLTGFTAWLVSVSKQTRRGLDAQGACPVPMASQDFPACREKGSRGQRALGAIAEVISGVTCLWSPSQIKEWHSHPASSPPHLPYGYLHQILLIEPPVSWIQLLLPTSKYQITVPLPQLATTMALSLSSCSELLYLYRSHSQRSCDHPLVTSLPPSSWLVLVVLLPSSRWLDCPFPSISMEILAYCQSQITPSS